MSKNNEQPLTGATGSGSDPNISGVVPMRSRRNRLLGGVALALTVGAAMVGSLFLFGREEPVASTPALTPTHVRATIVAVPTVTSVATVTSILTVRSVLPVTPTIASFLTPTVYTPVSIPSDTVTKPSATVARLTPAARLTATGNGTDIPAPVSTAALDPLPQPQVTSIQVQPLAPTRVSSGVTLYTVITGDNLSSLAARFGTTEGAIVAENKLASPVLHAGQVLLISPSITSIAGAATHTSSAPVSPTTRPTPSALRRTETVPHAVPSSVSTATGP